MSLMRPFSIRRLIWKTSKSMGPLPCATWKCDTTLRCPRTQDSRHWPDLYFGGSGIFLQQVNMSNTADENLPCSLRNATGSREYELRSFSRRSTRKPTAHAKRKAPGRSPGAKREQLELPASHAALAARCILSGR